MQSTNPLYRTAPRLTSPPENRADGENRQADAAALIDAACLEVRADARAGERQFTRDMAGRYERRRHLPPALGWTIPIPNGADRELMRRIIRALGHRLHDQVAGGCPGRRARLTRIALFGECLAYWRLTPTGDGPERE